MISIIIPFYNEAESLPTLIKHLVEVLEQIKGKTEIILVNDGSDDQPISKIEDQISKIQMLEKEAGRR